MRNLFIITALAFSLFSNAQKMSKEFLEGMWTSNEQATEILFSFTNKKEFLIQEISSTSGLPLDVISYQIVDNNIYIKTLFKKNNFESTSRFVIINKDTMVADILSEYPGQVIYKRVLKN